MPGAGYFQNDLERGYCGWVGDERFDPAEFGQLPGKSAGVGGAQYCTGSTQHFTGHTLIALQYHSQCIFREDTQWLR